MNEKLEALQLLIENRIFASSSSALAKILGYKGKMTFYRIMKGDVSFKIVNGVWDKLLNEFQIGDDTLYDIARICNFTKFFYDAILPEMNTEHPKWVENVIIALMEDEYVHNSSKFNEEIVPILKNLKRNEPNVFWGMATLFYMKAKGIDAYQKDFKQVEYDLLDGLDKLLFALHPENANARRAVIGLKSVILQHQDTQSTWWLLFHGNIVFQYYSDPAFIYTAIQTSQLFDWPARSYWIIPESTYQKGAKVWLLVKVDYNGTANGFYMTLQLEAGNNIETFTVKNACVLQFLTVDTEDDCPLLLTYKMIDQKKEYCYYLYDYVPDNQMLYLTCNPEVGSLNELPEQMYRIDLSNPCGKNEKIWSRILNIFDKGIGEELYQNAVEDFTGEIDLKDKYMVKDVIMNRDHLSLILVESGVECEYRLSIDAYSFLSNINPTHTIIITEHKNDAEVYVEWPFLGYSIKLSEFTLVK